MTRADGDAGSATVWVLLSATVVWSVATWGLAVASVGAARHQASTAADLAALAGAANAVLGERVACETARGVAVANGATLRSCGVDAAQRSVDLLVEFTGHGLLAHAPPALARARAGPDSLSVGR